MFSKTRDWLGHRSLRFRLTLLFSVILAGALTVFSLLLYRSFVDAHLDDFDIALYNHAVDISEGIDINAVDQILRHGLPSGELESVKMFPFSLSRTFMQIRSADGKILAHAGPPVDFELPFGRRDSRLLRTGRDSTFLTLQIENFVKNIKEAREKSEELEDESYRLINFPLDDSPSPQFILQIAAPLTLVELQRTNLRQFFYFSIPAALVLAALGGYALAARALQPVDTMVREANAIGVEQLSSRLPVPVAKDELQRLALTMNGLLARVEQAMSSQERFIADASHQLLTPLAILRGELDVVSEGDPEDVHRFHDSASQEIDRLSRTVRDMLLLARVDAGRAALTVSKVRLDEIVLEALERVDRVAQQKSVRLRFRLGPGGEPSEHEEIFETRGDRDLLFALLHNLIENAVKYSPSGGIVEISLSTHGDWLRTSIADQGPGVPAADLPRIFERFYRSSNTQKTEGIGLGLAIAKKISDLHQGELEVTRNEPHGAIFSFSIKKFV